MESSDQIRINQIGYYPQGTKQAVIVGAKGKTEFKLIEMTEQQIVFTGKLSIQEQWPLSEEWIQVADFSEWTSPGTYRLQVVGLGMSHEFMIKTQVLEAAFKGSVKGLYYQRCGADLLPKHAGKWHRKMGHPDEVVYFHPSSGKEEGAMASPKGWYDAGDFNKYVLNASFPLGQLFLLQEQYTDLMKEEDLNIPESGNGRSDFLDELKYEMDWVLSMQDEDGGLFHKLTAKKFEAMVMPEAAISKRYIVGKGTAATLDFAAAAAQAYRVFEKVDSSYAEQCLAAAKRAYQWAKENPKVIFENPEDIHTGEYGDKDFADEWFWASAELFVATETAAYLEQIVNTRFIPRFKVGEGWAGFMRFLGLFSLLENESILPSFFAQKLKQDLLQSAEDLVGKANSGAYFQPLQEFRWGSNSDILNAAMIMAQAYRLTADPRYLSAVQQSVNYIFGTNAIGYSFLTGFGDKTPQFIHHRQSAADGIAEPVPGLLSGGPNSHQQDVKDGTVYPENCPPMKSWVDQESSYASNEICLNWNAPLTYILGFLEQESK